MPDFQHRLRSAASRTFRPTRRPAHEVVSAARRGRGMRVQPTPGWSVAVSPAGYEDLRNWLRYEGATLALLRHLRPPAVDGIGRGRAPRSVQPLLLPGQGLTRAHYYGGTVARGAAAIARQPRRARALHHFCARRMGSEYLGLYRRLATPPPAEPYQLMCST